MMFELFVGISYKSTCVSFVLNPKAPKVMAIYMDNIYQEWFLCLKALHRKSCCYSIQRIIIRPTFNVMATICILIPSQILSNLSTAHNYKYRSHSFDFMIFNIKTPCSEVTLARLNLNRRNVFKHRYLQTLVE